MYLKALYSGGKDVAKGTCREDCEANKLERKLMVNDIGHIHVLRMNHMDNQRCTICLDIIFDNPWKCETCNFQAHDYCAELGQPSRHRLHLKHDLVLLPSYPTRVIMKCNTCRVEIRSFSLLCRICNLITCMRCVVRFNQCIGVLRRGQKVIGATRENCTKHYGHYLLQVKVSVSYLINCIICDERLCGNILSCMECGDIYHPLCIKLVKQRLLKHPLHSHVLNMEQRRGSNCIACKLKIIKSGFFCHLCEVGFHIKCSEGVDVSSENNSHEHTFYNFWIDDNDHSRVIRACSVCGRPCGPSFYGCIECNFCAHVECLGFPASVRNQQHQHTVLEDYDFMRVGNCALCGSKCDDKWYSCKHCGEVFHKQCIMKMDDREATTEEEKLGEVFFMFIERLLLTMFEKEKKEQKELWMATSNDPIYNWDINDTSGDKIEMMYNDLWN